MTGVHCYTVHDHSITHGPTDFRLFQVSIYKFHLWEDLLRESLDLCHDFTGLEVVLSFCCLLLMFFLELLLVV